MSMKDHLKSAGLGAFSALAMVGVGFLGWSIATVVGAGAVTAAFIAGVGVMAGSEISLRDADGVGLQPSKKTTHFISSLVTAFGLSMAFQAAMGHRIFEQKPEQPAALTQTFGGALTQKFTKACEQATDPTFKQGMIYRVPGALSDTVYTVSCAKDMGR